MVTQEPMAKRMLPLEVVESSAPPPSGALPLYEFEPSAASVLDALLPRYVEARIYNAMLQAAASEHAARRRAMKSATDNADELIKSLTGLANAALQDMRHPQSVCDHRHVQVLSLERGTGGPRRHPQAGDRT